MASRKRSGRTNPSVTTSKRGESCGAEFAGKNPGGVEVAPLTTRVDVETVSTLLAKIQISKTLLK
jgi:hypothetical protein